VVSAFYQTATPPLEASDEGGHFAFVLHVKEHHRLPDARRLSDAILGHQEMLQPPLYYVLGALVAAPVDTRDAYRFFVPRPNAPIGRADIAGPKNMWLQGGNRSFPYRRTRLAIALVRALSMLMGIATVILTYQIGRAIAPGDRWIARLAAALVAFNPMFVFIASSINNDNLATMLVCWCVLLLVQNAGGPVDRAAALRLGVLTGAAALTKVSALILAPILTVGLLARRQPQVRAWLVAGVVAAALWVWWPIRNQALYGDWFGLTALAALAHATRPDVRPWALLEEWSGFVKSYWGVFGGFNVVFPEPFYRVFYLFSALGVGGAAVVLLRPGAHAAGVRLLGFVSLVNLVAVAHWTSGVTGSQGRYMFPSIAAMAVLFALGASLTGRRARTWIAAAAVGFLIFTAFYGALVLIPSEYP
jgi:4-amino-4-deoxy-L-arabinose transferase-like glycosyltransferase